MEQSPERRLQEFESNTHNYRFNRDRELQEIANECRATGLQNKGQEILVESTAFKLCTHGDTFPGYFQPMFVFTDGQALPPLSYFTPERLAYLSLRAIQTKNPIHAARYADVAWDLASQKNIEMARLAIDRYLDCVEVFKRNNWGIEMASALKRAASLASLIRDKGRRATIQRIVLDLAQELDGESEYRFCLELSEALISTSREGLAEDEIEVLIKILDQAIAYYMGEHPRRPDDETLGPVEGPNEHLVRSFHEAKIRLAKDLQFRQIDVTTERRSIVASWEREGDRAAASGNYLAATAYYKNAEEAFRNLGLRQDMERLRIKMANTGVRAEADMEEVSASVRIEDAEVEAYISPLISTSLEKTLQRVSAAPHFIPNVARAEKATEEQRKKYPLQFLFGQMDFRDGYVVGVYESEDELLAQALKRNLILEMQIGDIFRGRLFEIMKSELGLDSEGLLAHFKAWGVCKHRDLVLLKRGFEAYFCEDHVAALHILIPRFEDLLRTLLQQAGQPVGIPGRGVVVLSTLLQDSALSSVAGIDLIRFYDLALSDPDGLNLRNLLCHGLMEPETMTKDLTELILHLLLSLTRFRLTKEFNASTRGDDSV